MSQSNRNGAKQAVALKYDELFSRDMTQADMDAFYILDSMVAAAIENDIHINIAMYSFTLNFSFKNILDNKTDIIL